MQNLILSRSVWVADAGDCVSRGGARGLHLSALLLSVLGEVAARALTSAVSEIVFLLGGRLHWDIMRGRR